MPRRPAAALRGRELGGDRQERAGTDLSHRRRSAALSFVNARWQAASGEAARQHCSGGSLADSGRTPSSQAAQCRRWFKRAATHGVRSAPRCCMGRRTSQRHFDLGVWRHCSRTGAVVGFAGSAIDVTERLDRPGASCRSSWRSRRCCWTAMPLPVSHARPPGPLRHRQPGLGRLHRPAARADVPSARRARNDYLPAEEAGRCTRCTTSELMQRRRPACATRPRPPTATARAARWR